MLVPFTGLDLHMAKHERSGELQQLRQREAREAERAAQQLEYERALEEDQRAEREREEEEARRRREVEEARRAKEAEEREAEERAREEAARERAAQERQRRAQEALPPEPAAGAGVTVIKVRLPDGSTVQRRFQVEGPVSQLFDFLHSLPQLLGTSWSLTPPPYLELEGALYPSEESLSELGMRGGVVLNLCDTDA